MRTALFWVITQQVLVISYRRFGIPVPKRRQEITTIQYCIAQYITVQYSAVWYSIVRYGTVEIWYSSRSSSLCSFLQSPVICTLLDPLISLCTLYPNTSSLYSSLNITNLQYLRRVTKNTKLQPLR